MTSFDDCLIDININLPEPNRVVYAPLDVISGNIELKVFEELNVNRIEFTLIGIATTFIRGAVGKNQFQNFKESHLLLYDNDVLFPQSHQSVRDSHHQQDNNILDIGEYNFKYGFKIPLYPLCSDSSDLNLSKTLAKRMARSKLLSFTDTTHFKSMLPPSSHLRMKTNDAGYDIEYYLRLQIFHKEGRVTEVKKPFVIFPFQPDLHTSGPLAVRSEEFTYYQQKKMGNSKSIFKAKTETVDVPFTFEVVYPSKNLMTGLRPIYKVYIVSKYPPERYEEEDLASRLGLFYINKIEMFVHNSTHFTCQKLEEKETHAIKLLFMERVGHLIDLRQLKRRSVDEWEILFPVDKLLNNTKFIGLTPEFESCKIEKSYKIEFKFGISEKMYGSKQKNIQIITDKCRIVNNIAPNPEYNDIIELESNPLHAANINKQRQFSAANTKTPSFSQSDTSSISRHSSQTSDSSLLSFNNKDILKDLKILNSKLPELHRLEFKPPAFNKSVFSSGSTLTRTSSHSSRSRNSPSQSSSDTSISSYTQSDPFSDSNSASGDSPLKRSGYQHHIHQEMKPKIHAGRLKVGNKAPIIPSPVSPMEPPKSLVLLNEQPTRDISQSNSRSSGGTAKDVNRLYSEFHSPGRIQNRSFRIVDDKTKNDF